MAFKIGDKITLTGDPTGYDFGEDIGVPKKGEIYTISAVEYFDDPRNNCYSIEGSYTQEPVWSDMEKYFSLVTLSWKERLEK